MLQAVQPASKTAARTIALVFETWNFMIGLLFLPNEPQ
jgi:hypothetical protein